MRFIGQSASHMTCHYVGHVIQRQDISTVVSCAFRHPFGQVLGPSQGEKMQHKKLSLVHDIILLHV